MDDMIKAVCALGLKIGFLFLLGFAGALAQAQTICRFFSLRCSDCSVKQIECNNLSSGYISTERTKLKGITVEVIDTTNNNIIHRLTLKNPKGFLKDYDNDKKLNKNEWIENQLKKRGVALTRRHEIQAHPESGYHFDDQTVLYEDFELEIRKTRPLGYPNDIKPRPKPLVPYLVQCEYAGRPVVLKCGGQNICSAPLTCIYSNGSKAAGAATCLAKNKNSCPSPRECALDEQVKAPAVYDPETDQNESLLKYKIGGKEPENAPFTPQELSNIGSAVQ